jgi:hypothetical protein
MEKVSSRRCWNAVREKVEIQREVEVGVDYWKMFSNGWKFPAASLRDSTF